MTYASLQTRPMAQPIELECPAVTEAQLLERVKALLPAIAARGRAAEADGRVADETIAEIEAAGLLDMLVTKSWGGKGFGLGVFYETVRLLARADLATAWVASFLIEHSLWACRLSMAAQKEIFADRTHVGIATTQSPMAKAVRVPGGYRLSGKYPYSSIILHSEYCIYPGTLFDEQPAMPMMFLVDVADVKILDDWKVSAMAATGSRTGIVEDVFIPEHRALPMPILFSGTAHPGIVHPEPINRARLMESLVVQMGSMAVGSAEAVLEMGRLRLSQSAPFGVKRINRTTSQVRWAEAWQKLRLATALYETSVKRSLDKEASGEAWTDEEVGQNELDSLTIVHTCKDAVRMILDGAGSSAFQLDYAMQRQARDLGMISTHVLATDHDVIAERGARLVLGLGRNAIDPPIAP